MEHQETAQTGKKTDRGPGGQRGWQTTAQAKGLRQIGDDEQGKADQNAEQEGTGDTTPARQAQGKGKGEQNGRQGGGRLGETVVQQDMQAGSVVTFPFGPLDELLDLLEGEKIGIDGGTVELVQPQDGGPLPLREPFGLDGGFVEIEDALVEHPFALHHLGTAGLDMGAQFLFGVPFEDGDVEEHLCIGEQLLHVQQLSCPLLGPYLEPEVIQIGLGGGVMAEQAIFHVLGQSGGPGHQLVAQKQLRAGDE